MLLFAFHTHAHTQKNLLHVKSMLNRLYYKAGSDQLKLVTSSLNSCFLFQWKKVSFFWLLICRCVVMQTRLSVVYLFFHLHSLNVCTFALFATTQKLYTLCIPGNKQSKQHTSHCFHNVFGQNELQIAHPGLYFCLPAQCIDDFHSEELLRNYAVLSRRL